MKRLFLVILLIFLFVVINNSVYAIAPPTQLATCDLCGYCPPNPAPGNWESCRACLYPNVPPNSETSNLTLIINPTTYLLPTPAPGHWNTMLGCISTNMNNFSQNGAAGSVMQTLLNIIFKVAGGIAFMYIIYGSFLILTSQAEPEKLNYGKRVVLGSVVGLIFCLSSVFLVNLIANGILRIPGFGQ